jgi:molybdenum cofactor biosynthesis enzyme MoaA
VSARIRLRSGGVLPLTVAEYDASRPAITSRRLRSFCYAPFLSMDFDAAGSICLCNHSHTSIAKYSEDRSVLDIWRGETYRRYRQEMREYVVDDENCRHCVRQCAAGAAAHTFAVEQFDRWAHDDPAPAYPRRLIFRLRNTCNLACIMCDGTTSSRIRQERDRLPPAPPAYGERFFKDMEEILPHVEHVEFYGGEPFLVREHLRIFEILERVRARCTIYVNTNAVSLHPRAKHFLEVLNFRTIAVSMDAVDPELHAGIRVGMDSDLFHRNLDYLLDLRARRGVDVMLNVTEHRKNWFELPQVFRFAERNRLHLHINTCIHPHNVTLYTLPSDQLAYVLSYLKRQQVQLLSEYPRLSNRAAYDYLLALIRGELAARTPEWQPTLTNLNHASDGLLAAPKAGVAPFDRPGALVTEARAIADTLDPAVARRLLSAIAADTQSLARVAGWQAARVRVEQMLDRIPVPEAIRAD